MDVLIEMAAHKNLAQDLKLLAMYGRLVVVGSRGDIEITPRDIMSREVTVTGMTLWATPERETAALHAALLAGMEAKIIRPIVTVELPLSAAAEAHRRIVEPGARGKIVLVP